MNEEGFLFINDRKSDMVISGDVNIYPAEVEAVLLELPGVKDAAVFGVPDPEFGERVVAVVEPDGPRTSPDALLEGLQQRLARYKLPREIHMQATLPREDSGKIKKRLLRQRWMASTDNGEHSR